MRKEWFLEALAQGLELDAAADAAGRTLRMFYYWRKDDPEFAEAWDEAERQGVIVLSREARRRAVDGTRKYLYHQGQPVYFTDPTTGEYVRDDAGQLVHAFEITYSDTLLLALMNARDPERYCPRVRAAKIQRRWDKEDGRAGQGATIPAETVISLLTALAEKRRAEPEPPASPG